MIAKRVQTAGWNFGQPSLHLLNTFSKGFDTDQLQKIAADLTLAEINIEPKKGKEYLHIITTGAGEVYGANSNADWFNGDKHAFEFPHAKEAAHSSRMLAGGLKGYHNTYMTFGGVYRNHNNGRKGFDKEGAVVWERYYEPMHRGEVVVELDPDNWSDDLQKVASGEHISFSMGMGVKEDFCSWCGHAAKSRNNYCDHLKYAKLTLDKEGHQCFAINDAPHFHDISRVKIPSEKIALVLAKVASEGATLDLAETFLKEQAAGLYVPIQVLQKIASKKEACRAELLYKLAEMEKQLNAEGNAVVQDVADSFLKSDEESDEIVNKLSPCPIEHLMPALINNNSLLTPTTFVRIVLKKEPADIAGVSGFEDALKDVFTDLKENADPDTVLNDGSYSSGVSCPSASVSNTVRGLSDLLSLDPEPVQRRVIKITITGKPETNRKVEKEASSDEPSIGARLLAREYGKYQLSFLAATSKPENLLLTCSMNRR